MLRFETLMFHLTLSSFFQCSQWCRCFALDGYIKDINIVKQEVLRLANKVSIMKGTGLNDRFILTRGEGWSVGHSLKDFGSESSYLTKMLSSADVESASDDNW